MIKLQFHTMYIRIIFKKSNA